MAQAKSRDQKKSSNGATVGYEQQLWQMADALRGSMDAAEYKHVVLGLIFLKYISDAFEEQHAKLEAEKAQGADPEDPDEYRALSIFWVPPEARWSHLKAQAKQPTIGELVDDSMSGIERDNPSLKGVLPKDYARPALDKQRLGQIIDLIANIKVGDSESRSKDVLGQVYQYFLKQFALAEGRKGGEFWTPQSVVQLLVEMLEPYKGRVYDPCSGTGGMFVQSVRFIDAHAKGNGNGSRSKGAISIYGQESNYTTWRLARMNLAIRGIDAQIAHGDTFHNDRHPDLRADFILANPHFNDSDWRGELLRDDKRWQFGKPPVGNANFAWVQHIIYHLAPTGIAGFVLANGSMSSNQSGEGEIRKNIIEADLVDCMIALPGQLFYSTQIPACLWFICRDKSGKPSPAAWRHPLPLGEGQSEGVVERSAFDHLFPDRFEDCELGEIPAGWHVGPILTQAKLLSGGTPKTDREDYWDGDILWASAKDVSQCGETFLITTERCITHKGLDESATQLIPRFCSVVVARGATTGRMVMVGREMAMNQTCYALASKTDTPFGLQCRLQWEMDDLVHAAHGSVFDTITTSTFANSKVVLPPVPLLKAFDQKVSPMFQRILGNTEEIQTLAAVRDGLLPRLISGALRVKDAARYLEA